MKVHMKSKEVHHVSPIISYIVPVPDINITSLFSLDYMHLLCLGVMKKLINLWMNNGHTSLRLSSHKIKHLSLNLKKCKAVLPMNLLKNREELKSILEFRQLLLYTLNTIPIVFKNVLSDECYKHFMSLNISMRIHLSKDHSEYSNYVVELLNYFKPDCFVLTSKKFNSKENLFEKPISSSKLDIFIVKDLFKRAKEWYTDKVLI
ncbi:hypothetical protein AGLY_009008 [Aphis glycines]|uniref:Uncharacterized protein n=1 Tax=Aphis glycines TaxID=307491 RepID=A0A6G0TL06_APHGL|nr:hypothetical protein AGLY_009008 [Aphis glycines]